MPDEARRAIHAPHLWAPSLQRRANTHEHLGQSIAYARMNGVMPSWTAEALKKNPKMPQE